MVVLTTIYSQASTSLIVNNYEIGSGTFNITEMGVEWISSVAPKVKIEASEVLLTAKQIQPMTHIFMLVKCRLILPGLPAPVGGPGGSNQEKEIYILNFVPPEQEIVAVLYDALNKMASLNKAPKMKPTKEELESSNLGEQLYNRALDAEEGTSSAYRNGFANGVDSDDDEDGTGII